MKWCPTPRFMAVLTAALLISLLAVSGFAQFQTGNIYGKVQAKDGSVLPGVTVVLTGFGAPQTTTTDAQGNFRFLNLSPGAGYSLKAELAGYGTATRGGVGVRVDIAAPQHRFILVGECLKSRDFCCDATSRRLAPQCRPLMGR